MLNRRILRIKAFKVLYAYAEDPAMTLRQALSMLEASSESTRDLYLLMLSVIPPLTALAQRQAEAARSKFNPTEEERHPKLKFVCNALAPLLENDPDFSKLTGKKQFSWDQYDAFLFDLFESIKSRDWFRSYLEDGKHSLGDDVRLFKKIYQHEFEDNETLYPILEDMSILWTDDLGYVLSFIIKDLDQIARTGRWELPPLYNSDLMIRQGKSASSDQRFVTRLLTTAFGNYRSYAEKVASLVSHWDSERLFTTDLVLIAMGLAESEAFPDIPIRVTINEYVEISKYYSTPKSGSFVNGLLDRLIKESAAEGKINKI